MQKKINSVILALQFISLFGLIGGIRLLVDIKLRKKTMLTFPGVRHPVYLRPDTSDIATFFQIFVEGQYNINIDYNPSIIIDAGANVGLFSVLLKNKFPDTKFICIEPDPENFEILKKNVSLYDDIYCENAGLWHSDTMLSVYDKYNFGKWGMVVEEDIEKGNIPAISVNYIMQKYNLSKIDIFKIDIETSEKQLFSRNYEWLSNTGKMIIELHDWIEPGCAMIFFKAVNETIPNFKLMCKGENIIVDNSKFY